ncbi:MAG: hypothetical protein V3Q69_06885 [Burkholderia sp.]
MLHKSSVRTQWHRLKLCPSMPLRPHARFMQQRWVSRQVMPG